MDNEPEQVEVIEPLETSPIPENNFSLTLKQQRFIEAYKKLGDANKAAISAGYAVKSVAVEANRLLKNPKILEALKSIRSARQAMISKDDFVQLAIDDYRQLDVTEPNKPRFLDIAGKTLGYIGNVAPQTVNNTLNITKIEVNALNAPQKWEALRSLLE